MFGSKKRERKRYEEYRELKSVASNTVLFYFQSWGQGQQGRIDALNKAIAAAGISAELVQFRDAKEMQDVSVWSGSAKECERAVAFRDELSHCFPLGQFESEESAVMSLISRYRGDSR